jgi:hypothetical protein
MNNAPDLETRDDDLFYEVIDDAPLPYWTRRRIVLLIFALLIVAALLAYSLPGLFLTPAPLPTLAPGSYI